MRTSRLTGIVIIVSAHRDMLGVCRAALRVHAPELRVCIVATSRDVEDWLSLSTDTQWVLDPMSHDARDHAAGIEMVRAAGAHRGADLVILLDDDTIILSDRWWPMIETAFAVQPGLGLLGGIRSRGLIGQSYVNGMWLVHAHMMVMRRELFEATDTFQAEALGARGYIQLDTAARACVEAASRGYASQLLPWHEPGVGPCYGPSDGTPGISATEYFDPGDPAHTLWAHLGRGTSFARRSWAREYLRRCAARLGSPRAAKILRRQGERDRFVDRSWELLMGPRSDGS